jgi:NAD(P)-dependent dehydrogenase (short-subunit alcohol dehydrogenase family)
VDLAGRSVVVTGGASGIGRAMCLRFAEEGARGTVVADIDGDGAKSVAEAIRAAGHPAVAAAADVSTESGVAELVRAAESSFGPIDLFCSNAGIAVGGGPEAPDADWERAWRVNLMSHVYAARTLLPTMLERHDGYLLNTASAAGLLTNLGAAPYSVTKHAAVALAEWLSITYGDSGVKVSCICPQGVRTRMLVGALGLRPEQAEEILGTGGSAVLAAGGVIEPEQVADAAVEGVRSERFLILPHPEVAEYFRQRADDHERWLRGMRRMQRSLRAEAGGGRER